MAKEIKVKAIRLTQVGPNKESHMYIATLRAGDLIDRTMFKVDVWKDEYRGAQDKQGYQRPETTKRAKKIAKFLTEHPNACFPTALTLSSRKPLAFRSTDGAYGELVIGANENEYPIYIVDGQHRIAGIREAIESHDSELADMELACTFLVNFDKAEEVKQFWDMNSLQRRVSTDLAQQLMRDMSSSDVSRLKMFRDEDELWKVRALDIVDLVNSDPKGVWNKLIKTAHLSEVEKKRTVVAQTSFVVSLKPFLSNSSSAPDKIADIVTNYWNAIASVFPDAFSKPQDYLIQKTPGLFPFHMILPKLVMKLGEDGATEDNFRRLLEAMVEQDEENEGEGCALSGDFWRRIKTKEERRISRGAGQYGSMKGFKILADRFLDDLTEAGVL